MTSLSDEPADVTCGEGVSKSRAPSTRREAHGGDGGAQRCRGRDERAARSREEEEVSAGQMAGHRVTGAERGLGRPGLLDADKQHTGARTCEGFKQSKRDLPCAATILPSHGLSAKCCLCLPS